MTEADILALTYQDSCWVYRPQKTTLPSGESVFQKGLDGRQVYENILFRGNLQRITVTSSHQGYGSCVRVGLPGNERDDESV